MCAMNNLHQSMLCALVFVVIVEEALHFVRLHGNKALFRYKKSLTFIMLRVCTYLPKYRRMKLQNEALISLLNFKSKAYIIQNSVCKYGTLEQADETLIGGTYDASHQGIIFIIMHANKNSDCA